MNFNEQKKSSLRCIWSIPSMSNGGLRNFHETGLAAVEFLQPRACHKFWWDDPPLYGPVIMTYRKHTVLRCPKYLSYPQLISNFDRTITLAGQCRALLCCGSLSKTDLSADVETVSLWLTLEATARCWNLTIAAVASLFCSMSQRFQNVPSVAMPGAFAMAELWLGWLSNTEGWSAGPDALEQAEYGWLHRCETLGNIRKH